MGKLEWDAGRGARFTLLTKKLGDLLHLNPRLHKVLLRGPLRPKSSPYIMLSGRHFVLNLGFRQNLTTPDAAHRTEEKEKRREKGIEGRKEL